MKIPYAPSLLAAAVLALGSLTLTAGTNGFVAPPFRGTVGTEFGYWENFTVPSGAPGNLPDQPNATTTAVLTQSSPSALIAGSGNLYNPGGLSAFTLSNNVNFTVGTLVLQVRTGGSELDYSSLQLNYTDTNGVHTLAPLFRYELSRIGAPGQGASVSSLWQWDFAGLVTTNYTITFVAAGSSLSLDSIMLDVAPPAATPFLSSVAFPQQPFKVSGAANLARWMYPFNGNPAARATASVFGALGSAPDFDSRDAQYLLSWSTTNRVPTGQGVGNYALRRARVTLTIASGNQYPYSSTLRDYRSYFPTNDVRYVATTNVGSPVELFGAGFRGGFTNGNSEYVPYAATNYLQAGPFFADASAGTYTNRAAFAAGFDADGVLVDISNNVQNDGTNEVGTPFEIAPFAVGQNPNLAAGDLMPLGSQLTFDLNLNDPLIYAYVQRGLNEGNLSFVVVTLAEASFTGPPSYPNFYTIFSPIATPAQYPQLKLEGAVVRSTVDSDGDGLADDWENFHLGTLAYGATNDVDGDGVGNLAEAQAGTRPLVTSDAFRQLSLTAAAGQAEVHFTPAPGKSYAVAWTTNFTDWQTVTNPAVKYSSAWLDKQSANPVYPSPVYAAWRDLTATNAQRFYRVGAK